MFYLVVCGVQHKFDRDLVVCVVLNTQEGRKKLFGSRVVQPNLVVMGCCMSARRRPGDLASEAQSEQFMNLARGDSIAFDSAMHSPVGSFRRNGSVASGRATEHSVGSAGSMRNAVRPTNTDSYFKRQRLVDWLDGFAPMLIPSQMEYSVSYQPPRPHGQSRAKYRFTEENLTHNHRDIRELEYLMIVAGGDSVSTARSSLASATSRGSMMWNGSSRRSRTSFSIRNNSFMLGDAAGAVGGSSYGGSFANGPSGPVSHGSSSRVITSDSSRNNSVSQQQHMEDSGSRRKPSHMVLSPNAGGGHHAIQPDRDGQEINPSSSFRNLISDSRSPATSPPASPAQKSLQTMHGSEGKDALTFGRTPSGNFSDTSGGRSPRGRSKLDQQQYNKSLIASGALQPAGQEKKEESNNGQTASNSSGVRRKLRKHKGERRSTHSSTPPQLQGRDTGSSSGGNW